MPKIEVIRKGITPAVRPVPTDTTLAILPTTLDRVGREVEDEDEQPVRIDSVNDAFEKFKPSIRFETSVGEGATEFVAELEFHSLKDFAPENIQKRVPGQRNDIADLQNTHRPALSLERSLVAAGGQARLERPEAAASRSWRRLPDCEPSLKRSLRPRKKVSDG